MSKPMTWLLAGALALTTPFLAGGAALAQADTARRQANEDSAAAAPSDRPDRADRAERRQMRVYRQGGGVHHARRGDYLSDVLQLRPDQEPALKAFLEATRRDEDHRDHMVKFERDTERTTLQRLDEMQARMAEQQAETGRKIAAIKTFYAQLDAKQQKAFDAMPMLMFSGPSFGPMLIPVGHHMPMPPEPPEPPPPPRL